MRYIDSLNLKDNLKCFILVEPGLGYMIPVLQERFKDSTIIALHIKDFSEPSLVQKHLEEKIPNIDVNDIQIIEWRPSLNHYKEAYVNLLSQVVDFIKRTDAGNRTTAAFGRRWIRNFFRNLKNINKNLLYKQAEIPVIITGSSPGLEKALPLIKEMQDSCIIIAASSSYLALHHNGIKADLIISTDGGPWALKHLYPFFRHGSCDNTALAVNLCSALPSQCCETPRLLINDGSFWQNIILHELSLPSVLIPQRGTVTATALELAMILSCGNIYLAGMDFSFNDIRSHVKPYSFDNLFFTCADRFNPFYSQCFTRSSLINKGGSMDIYAAWFKTQLPSWQKRIFAIGESNIFETGVPLKNNSGKNKNEYFKIAAFNNNDSQIAEKGVAALFAALKNPEYAENIRHELTSLLFSSGKKVTDDELKTEINNIARTQ